MRVGLVVDELARGGTERQFTLLAQALADAGVGVEVFVLKPIADAGRDQLEVLRSAGVRAIGGGAGAYPSWLRRFAPDVVQVAMLRTSLLAAAYSLTPGAPPLVMSRRYLSSARQDSWLRTRATRAALRQASAIIANSRLAAEDSSKVEGVPLERYTVIGNIIPESAFASVPPARIDTDLPVIVNVASLRPQKGHVHLVEAAALLADRGRPVTVLCLGDDERWPETAAQVRRQVSEAGVDVRLLGDVADPRPYLAAADVVAQASVAEGLSNALLEAMAAGRPIVATGVGGTADVLLESGPDCGAAAAPAGLVVPPADAVALAEAIGEMLTSPQRAAAFGEAARRRARTHDAEAAVAAHLALYRAVLG
ncbi:MAG: glycosyltransferase [Actinobacteria bacterium]|nr:glycosyltransferase [Actinomycetota bacterium]